jgi:crotonobetaine/carnitine-CoA ligase
MQDASSGQVSIPQIPLHDRNLSSILRLRARNCPERIALQYLNESYNFAALDTMADRLANALAELGVRKGTTIAVMLPNVPDYVFCWLGAARLGALIVPINTDYVGTVLTHQLGKADVSHMLIEDVYQERLAAVIGELPKLTTVWLRGPGAPVPKLSKHARIVPAETLRSASDQRRTDPVAHVDGCAIAFTSGTTGPSKGILASHAHIVNFALNFMKCTSFGDGHSIYSCLPQFHALASWLGVVPMILAGGRIVLAERFSASRFWDDVRKYSTTHVHGIFSMIPILLKQPSRENDAEQPARTWYIGQQNDEFEARFNCRIIEVFGLSESGINMMHPPGRPRRRGSCGLVNSDDYDVVLADEDDVPVPMGTVGEILVRPKKPLVMFDQYYNAPQETVNCFRNLWFHTGDNGRQDAEGYYYFVDRKKDVIRRRGENISSYEIECIIVRHPGIAEVAAIAAQSDVGEDEVKLVVVRSPDSAITAEDLWKFCEDHMPRFWVPRFIEFRTSVPKTPTHKIQKYLLRQGIDQGEVFDRGAGHRQGGGGSRPADG